MVGRTLALWNTSAPQLPKVETHPFPAEFEPMILQEEPFILFGSQAVS